MTQKEIHGHDHGGNDPDRGGLDARGAVCF